MYLIPTKNHWACDIEADNLLDKATRIWCATAINCVTREKKEFTDGKAFREFLAEHPDYILVGHNFIAYDAPMLNRFWNARIPISRLVDTFVLSQLYNPSMPRPKGLGSKKGAHSLEAWGLRLRYSKLDFNDFSKFTPEMLTYCMKDTVLTAYLFIKLSERMRSVGFSERGAEIEHLAWNIIQNKQKRNGFPFNYEKGHELLVTLQQRRDALKKEIYELWPPELLVVGEYAKSHKKNGEPTAGYTRHLGQYPRVELTDDGGYRVYDYVSFNLASPTQRIEKLLELGWKPTQFTKKTKTGGGNPKVDEDSLTAFAEESGQPEVKALAKWIVINSRANMLFNVKKNGEESGWLNSYNEDTGCVHGSLFIASTLRYRHNNPNSANIPAVRLKKDPDDPKVEHIQYGEDGMYTYECRDLWTAGPPGWTLVGIDGTGIQNRCLIHNLIKTVGEEAVADFKELSLHGDIHKRNIEVIELANKAAAKKFYYTLMMGGGGARLAADQLQFGTKMSAKEADAKKTALIKSMPGFYELIENLQKELEETGRIRLCDGTPILVSSPHMVIPYLLQGDESRLMKKAMILVDDEIRRRKLQKYILKVADIHDEWQYRAIDEVADEFIDFALPCFPRAGGYFNYLIQIDGDAKKGLTWAETH